MKSVIKTLFLACMLLGFTFVQQPAIKSSLTDSRDGKMYRTVRIGNLTWMAENLNFQTGNSWCYDNKKSNCEKYGRLYDWDTAMEACPAGWRLPTDEDWDSLVQVAGGRDVAGTKLKSKSRWTAHSTHGKGTDDFGFSALPGGFGSAYAGDDGYWWSATEYNATDGRFRNMGYDGSGVNSGWSIKSNLFSVRCLAD